MKSFQAKSSLPPGRANWLVLGAGVPAFIDAQHLVSYPPPSFVADLLIRPAFFLVVILCLAALFAEGAAPRGPWGEARRRIGFRLAVAIALALGLGSELVELLAPLQPETETIIWGSSGDGGVQSSGSLTYPVLKEAVEVAALAASLALSLVLVAVLVLAIFAPACAMRSGWEGIVGRSWRAIRKHWLAIFVRGFALFPILLIAVPIMAYWQVDDWSLGYDPTSEQVRQIKFAIEMCNAVGVSGIGWSAFASVALFGLFLWWIGRTTGVLLDRQE